MAILERSDTGAIAHLTMNAPERLNALSDEMLAALQAEFDTLKTQSNIRAVILSGAGKAFCAGHDLKQMTRGRQAEDGGRAYFKDLFDRCTRLMLTVRALPQPVIARVHGIATAAGCQLVASCDLAVAAETALFSTPGVNIGLFCSTPMVALSRNVSNKHAMEMLLTGDMVSAASAEEIGLVNRVVPAEELRDATMDLAAKIAGKSSLTLAIGKRAFYEQREMTLPQAYEFTSKVMVQNMLAHDAKEGIGAFIEKRAPHWRDK